MLTREAAGEIVDRLLIGSDNRESIINCLVLMPGDVYDAHPRLQGIVGIDMARILYDTVKGEMRYD